MVAFGSSGLVKQTATPAAGFAKQNGTPTILTYTAPADGNTHRVQVYFTESVSSAETGGVINVTWVAPDGTAGASALVAGSKAAGSYEAGPPGMLIIQSGSTVTVVQQTALTLGAATVWAEIWAL